MLEANNRRQAMSQKVKNLFDKTQAIPGVQEITEEEIAAEIDAYRRGEWELLQKPGFYVAVGGVN